MTESDWATSTDPHLMLAFLRDRGASERRLRLFACACCRTVWELLADERSRGGVDAAEKYADGLVSLDALREASRASLHAMEDAAGDSESAELGHAKWHAATAAAFCTEVRFRWYSAGDASREVRSAESCLLFESTAPGDTVLFPEPEATDGAAHAESLRDIFGNPFKPTPFDPSWRSETTVALARQMYESRDFLLMGVLSDALQDAGCADEDILNHCRGSGPHVRGCHVVDLVLNRS
jgi:hypothetical protein